MLKTLSLVLSFGFMTPPILAENKYLERVDRSAKILRELADDSEMLKTLIKKAECVTSLRIHKAGFIFGGKTGTGVTSCRTDDGLWSAASQTRLTGISAGYQIGVSKIEMLIFFMDKDSKYDIIDGEFGLEVDAILSVGENGKYGNIDFSEPVYAVAKTKGLYAGASLSGSYLEQVSRSNRKVYGPEYTSYEILTSRDMIFPEASSFTNLLEQYSNQ